MIVPSFSLGLYLRYFKTR